MEQIRVSTFAGPGAQPVIHTVPRPKVTLYPFSEEGIGRAVADAMAMKTVKSTIVPWPDLVQ